MSPDNTYGLKYSDGIAAARTLIALEANAAALTRRLPVGWELAPYQGKTCVESLCEGQTCLSRSTKFTLQEPTTITPPVCRRVSYIAFVSQALRVGTESVAHLHWRAYTEEPASVPGKYLDANSSRSSAPKVSTRSAEAKRSAGNIFGRGQRR
jgi:hypothetical protein